MSLIKHTEVAHVSDGSSSEDDISTLPSNGVVKKSTKLERAARKLASKMDLTPVDGVSRITVKRSSNKLIVIDNPEVFRDIDGVYIVFDK
jgi:NACalpha-BTF3-like transcription factor